MERVLVMKAPAGTLDELQHIRLIALVDENMRPVHLYLVGGLKSSLTRYDVLNDIYQRHTLPFVTDLWEEFGERGNLPCVLMQDGEPTQTRVLLSDESLWAASVAHIRFGQHSASQTPVEQDEDASQSYKEMKKHVNSVSAFNYMNNHYYLVTALEKTIRKALDAEFKEVEEMQESEKKGKKKKAEGKGSIIATECREIAEAVVRTNYAFSLSFNLHHTTKAAELTGHFPDNITRYVDRHRGTQLLFGTPELQAIFAQLPKLEILFDAQGFLSEEDLDDAVIQQLDEYALARKKGHKVKFDKISTTNWRFNWLNHPVVLRILHERREAAKVEEARLETARQEREAKKARDVERLHEYLSLTKITNPSQALKEKYEDYDEKTT
jgi:hypothetical protein